jgi:putative ABC transport system permease protein
MIGAFFSEAATVLLENPTRTLLTMIGLVIGVAAVIAIQIVGAGTAGAVNGILGSLDDRSFFVFPNARQANYPAAAFSYKDILGAQRAAPNVRFALPGGNVARVISAGHHHARLSISGDAQVAAATVALVYGRPLSGLDVASAAHVCVLSQRAYQRLFPAGGDPVGQSVDFGERRYVVVGVQGPPVQSIVPVNIGGDVSIPYTTYLDEYLRSQPLFAARFIVYDTSSIAGTEQTVVAYFKKLKGARADYRSFDRVSFSKTIDGIFAVLTLIVSLLGAVSLVVAGIGIMNIMLISVSERTREIGVRKAIGATRFQVLAQFFIEASLLSLCGCGLGLVLGLALGWLVDHYALVAISGQVPPLPWIGSVVVAVGFATLVTLGFGTYPAYRAARLDPIEALRYE